ncbi:MAG TPA: hypothetical protein VFK33_03650 [Bacillales bacterium]|nr:hypothetical protein [Bacillales bacterium]
MEDKLRHLRKHLDDTVLKDLDFGESSRKNVRKAIRVQAEKRARPWIYQLKNGLGVAVCLLLLFGGIVYAMGQQGMLGAQNQTGSQSKGAMQSSSHSKFSTYSAPLKKKKDHSQHPPAENTGQQSNRVAVPPNQNKVYLVRIMPHGIGWKLTGDSVLRTTDGGASWSQAGPAGQWHFGKGVFFYNADIAWAMATNENGKSSLIYTKDGGDQWHSSDQIKNGGFFDFVTPQDGWILQSKKYGTSDARIYRTKDGGQSWTMVADRYAKGNLPARGRITGIGFDRNNPEVGWATGYYPIKTGHVFLYQTTDGGIDWKSDDLSLPAWSPNGLRVKTFPPMFFTGRTLLPVTLTDLDTGTIQQILFYNLNQGQWVDPAGQKLDTPQLIYDFLNGDEGWIITNNHIYKTTDGGQSWDSINAGKKLIKAMSTGKVKELDLESDQSARLVVGMLKGDTVMLKTEDSGHSWHFIEK